MGEKATFPHAVIKYPNKSNVRKERLLSARGSRIQSILMEKRDIPP